MAIATSIANNMNVLDADLSWEINGPWASNSSSEQGSFRDTLRFCSALGWDVRCNGGCGTVRQVQRGFWVSLPVAAAPLPLLSNFKGEHFGAVGTVLGLLQCIHNG